jgi:hypothetical protein
VGITCDLQITNAARVSFATEEDVTNNTVSVCTGRNFDAISQFKAPLFDGRILSSDLNILVDRILVFDFAVGVGRISSKGQIRSNFGVLFLHRHTMDYVCF